VIFLFEQVFFYFIGPTRWWTSGCSSTIILMW